VSLATAFPSAFDFEATLLPFTHDVGRDVILVNAAGRPGQLRATTLHHAGTWLPIQLEAQHCSGSDKGDDNPFGCFGAVAVALFPARCCYLLELKTNVQPNNLRFPALFICFNDELGIRTPKTSATPMA
jgi:hypothetical protein